MSGREEFEKHIKKSAAKRNSEGRYIHAGVQQQWHSFKWGLEAAEKVCDDVAESGDDGYKYHVTDRFPHGAEQSSIAIRKLKAEP